MALDPEELGLEITQVFTDATPQFQKPVQRTVLVGEHFQIEEQLVLATYAGSALIVPYPELKLGALVEDGVTTPLDLRPEVEVILIDPTYGQFTLVGGGTDFTEGSTSVTLSAAVTRVVSLSAGVAGESFAVALPSTATFRDTSATFITDGVQIGDSMTIDAPSANAGGSPYTITAVISETELLLGAVVVDATAESYTISDTRALNGETLISYRARRHDLDYQLELIEQRQDIETVAGPADVLDPLGLASALHENAAPNNAFYVMAIPEDTATSHATALDTLEGENVYSVVPLRQNDETLDLSSQYKAHVLAESTPGINKFRITLQSRDVPELLVRVASHQVSVAGTMVTGPGVNELTLTDAAGNFLANGVQIGDVVKITASDIAALVTSSPFLVKSATATTLVLVDQSIAGLPSADVTYSVETQDFSLAEQSEFMGEYADGIGERRVTNLVSGKGGIQTIFTGDAFIPSFYANAVLAALVSSLPPQQGFSRTEMPGITGIERPTLGKYRRSDLNTMGAGGNLILVKENDAAAVTIRRQNTTDKSTADTAELSITKVVDWVSFAYLGALAPFIGKFNVVPSFFSSAQTVIDSLRHNLTGNEMQGIGPILLSAEVLEFAPVAGVKGEVKLVIDIEPPFPVNKIRLDLIV